MRLSSRASYISYNNQYNIALHRTHTHSVNQSAPSTPQIDIKKAPSFTQEQPHLDSYERALRARQAEVSIGLDILYNLDYQFHID